MNIDDFILSAAIFLSLGFLVGFFAHDLFRIMVNIIRRCMAPKYLHKHRFEKHGFENHSFDKHSLNKASFDNLSNTKPLKENK